MAVPTISGVTAAGAGTTYIPIDRFQTDMTIQLDSDGATTFSVEGTGHSILWNTAALAAGNLMNNSSWKKDPSNAIWNTVQASGTADVVAHTTAKYRALRIVISGGAGAVSYVINQGGGG